MPQPKKPRTQCLHCGGAPARANYVYCSNKCQRLAATSKRDAEWSSGGQPFKHSRAILDGLVRRFGRACQRCTRSSWEGQPIPLEVNHISGDSSDNRLVNVELICPNCHALTPTYKARNKGNGRQKRRERERAIFGYAPRQQ